MHVQSTSFGFQNAKVCTILKSSLAVFLRNDIPYFALSCDTSLDVVLFLTITPFLTPSLLKHKGGEASAAQPPWPAFSDYMPSKVATTIRRAML